jgi:hypothetical protein
VDTLSRRELLRRLARAAVVGPVMIATHETQSELLYKLAGWFGHGSAIGKWLTELWIRW